MRRTTTPAAGAIPARPGPQDAAEARDVVPGPVPADSPAGRPASRAAGAIVEPSAAGRADGRAEDHAGHAGSERADRPGGGRADRRGAPARSGPAGIPATRSSDRPAERLADRPGQPAAERATLRLRETDEPLGSGGPEELPEHPDEPPRFAPEWLRLREPADAAARARELLDPLRVRLADLPRRAGGLVVHDVGCGTGSMGRWLAPLLDGAQHWVLHDRDPYLLHFAAVGAPRSAADGSRVTVETRRGDLARLTPDALAGAGLVTASALLDVLTAEEVGALAAACAAVGCPALLTLSVAGRVELAPAHPLDAEITEAFNDHQRRTGMLGPDAVTVAAEAFAAHGATVRAHPSHWRLGPGESALTAQWLRGWVGAAVEQRPELGEPAGRYLDERLAACAAGELRVTVHHTDLLALSRPTGGAS
ncbi:hypothetical protein SAM23877_6306 [Streptomyces ambofaciens ATCC 23877]|uniref:Methyltransferase domain-containing protein n=1 Tax=Streptomyces ambofaciens (strain ATCC 23877 / 3486 / DSM 40053 / JCM 4204 / NBRC 12836 / NRRL B-2516) TaxID=278992 RepID=A0A0K2B2H4_STRA7|nr:hypothetical protein SAM23877_6306 [Streptomyces ambofaciens ATCC 23877]